MISLDTKHPSESYIIDIDFNPLLFGDTLSSAAVSAIDHNDNVVTDIFTDLGESAGVTSIRLKAGQNEFQYKITVVGTQADNSELELDLFLDVNSKRKPVLVEPFQTNRERIIGIDFSSVLQDKAIASVSFSALDLSGGSPGDIYVNKGFDVTKNLVSVLIQNLTTNNKDYLIYVIVTDTASTPNIYVEELFIPVRNK